MAERGITTPLFWRHEIGREVTLDDFRRYVGQNLDDSGIYRSGNTVHLLRIGGATAYTASKENYRLLLSDETVNLRITVGLHTRMPGTSGGSGSSVRDGGMGNDGGTSRASGLPRG